MNKEKIETKSGELCLPEYIWKMLEHGAQREEKDLWEYVSAVLIRQENKLYGDVEQSIYEKEEDFEEVYERAEKEYFESATHKVDSFEDDYKQCIFGKGYAAGFRYGVEKVRIKWRDGNEKPETDRTIFYESTEGNVGEADYNNEKDYFSSYDECYYSGEWDYCHIKRWCYLDELLKL